MGFVTWWDLANRTYHCLCRSQQDDRTLCISLSLSNSNDLDRDAVRLCESTPQRCCHWFSYLVRDGNLVSHSLREGTGSASSLRARIKRRDLALLTSVQE